MRWRQGLAALIAISVLVGTLTFGCTEADIAGRVKFGPNPATQGINDFQVTYTNTGDSDVIVTRVVARIDWPYGPPDIPGFNIDHDQVIDFFNGTRLVRASETTTFEKREYSGFWGTFNVYVTIDGRAVDESNVTQFNSTFNVTFNSEPDDGPLLAGPSGFFFAFVVMFLLFFGAFMFGFFIRKDLWAFEIEKTLELENIDDLQMWKWFDQIWWARGQRWKVLALYGAFSAVVALAYSLTFVG